MIEFFIFYWIFSAIVVVTDLSRELKYEGEAIIKDCSDFAVLIIVIMLSGIVLPIFIGITMADIDRIKKENWIKSDS